jgi:uncharacterized protein (TIGR00369 family)
VEEQRQGGATIMPEQLESRVREDFNRQQLMKTIGAELLTVLPGEVHLQLAFRPDLTQQHGFLHAGIITSIIDTACGYAAFSLLPAGTGVLTVEYKVNFLSPASGERFVAIGKVRRAGRTLTVCCGDVIGYADGQEKLIATMLATMTAVAP